MASISKLVRSLRSRSPLVRRSTRDQAVAACAEAIAACTELERLYQQIRIDDPLIAHLLPTLLGPDIQPYFTFAPPGHFYSPIPLLSRALAHVQFVNAELPPSLPGIDGRVEAQLELAAELAPLVADFHPPPTAVDHRRYFAENPAYGIGDAQVLQAILRHLRPKRIVEIGSGYSSALMLDVADEHLAGDVELTFIEPFDGLLRSLLRPVDLDLVELVTAPIQEVDPDRFEDLEAGDVVFIDSTHVVRTGSDVTRAIFEILPRLQPGVVVHFHDIFYPFEYPEDWIREGRAWTETYLVRAFLSYNEAFEIMLFPHQLLFAANDQFTALWPSIADTEPGALWLRRKQ